MLGLLVARCGVAVPASRRAGADAATKLTPQDRIEIQELTDGYPYKIDYCTNSGYDYADMYADDGVFGVASRVEQPRENAHLVSRPRRARERGGWWQRRLPAEGNARQWRTRASHRRRAW